MNTETTSQPADRELDARGLNCPLPILRTKKTLGELASGQTLRILTTDPGAKRDFEAFCKQTGNELVSVSGTGGELAFVLRRR